MGWDSNLPPIIYLERRLRYYTRKQTFLKNLIVKMPVTEKGKWFIKEVVRQRKGFNSDVQYRFKVADVKRAIKANSVRVKEYQNAIKKLKL